MPTRKRKGVLLAWVQSVKYLGTYVTSNLSEDTAVRYKDRDFINFIVKAWKLESITTLNELCSAHQKCSIFPNLENGMIQCIRGFNSVIDSVDLLEGFIMVEISDCSYSLMQQYTVECVCNPL